MLEYLALGEFLVAVSMGLAAVCAFVWGAVSGAFSDVESVKHRVLEAEGAVDPFDDLMRGANEVRPAESDGDRPRA